MTFDVGTVRREIPRKHLASWYRDQLVAACDEIERLLIHNEQAWAARDDAEEKNAKLSALIIEQERQYREERKHMEQQEDKKADRT